MEAIEENKGEIIIWSDLNIQFFGKCSGIIEKAISNTNDIVFLSEHGTNKEINSGFMAIRCNTNTINFFRKVLESDIENKEFFDQTAINELLQSNSIKIKWDIFPKQIWAFSHGGPPPLDIVLHHANCTFPCTINGKEIGSVQLKLMQYNKVRDYLNKNIK